MARVAGPPSGLGTARVAGVARTACVAGVTGRLSKPTASPRTCVARRAMFAATFALAMSDACSFGAATLGVCAASNVGTSSAGPSMKIRLNMLPPTCLGIVQRAFGAGQLSRHVSQQLPGGVFSGIARRRKPQLRECVAYNALGRYGICQHAKGL